MSPWRKATSIGLAVLIALVVIYDIAAFAQGGVEATISRVVLGASVGNPILPFAFGIVCGHLFWPQPTPETKKPPA